MQGILFVFLSWFFVLISIFYRKETKKYFLNLIVILFLISCSSFTFELFSIEINVAYFVLIFIISYRISLLSFREQIEHFFKGLIIGMSFSVTSMLAIYDPASFFINEIIISAFVIVLLTFFLSRFYIDRFRYLMIGLIQGEIFNFITFDSIKFKYIIGDLNWLDTLFFSIFVLTTIKYVSLNFGKKYVKNRKLVKN